MTNNFSFRRFANYAAAYYSQDMRGNILKIAGFAIFTAFMYLFFLYIANTFPRISEIRGFCGMTAFLIWAYTISRSFRFYFKPSTASFQFMLPASRSEKFTFAILSNIVVVPLILALLFLINDYVWVEVTGQNGIFDQLITFPQSWDGEKYVFESPFQFKYFWNFYLPVIMVYFFVSIFFLGSVVFRRHQLFYTLIFLFVSGTFLSILNKIISPFTISVMTRLRDSIELNWGLFIMSLVFTVMTAVNIYLAWRRFSKIQITK